MIAQTLIAPVQPNKAIDLVVVRFHVVVANWPIIAQPVDALSAKVVGSEAQRNSAPMVRPPTEHARAPPTKLCAGRARERLTVDLPTAIAGVELAEWTTVN